MNRSAGIQRSWGALHDRGGARAYAPTGYVAGLPTYSETGTAGRTPSEHFAGLPRYSQIVARLQWDANAIDLVPDARAWSELPAARRRRLTTLLAGFRVAEDAVAEHLVPFADVTEPSDPMLMWIFFLQRRDEDRHARFFDRVAAEVLGLPGETPAQRRAAARTHVPAAVLELFEVRLPRLAAELAAGRTGVAEGVCLYHMVLEGVVFGAGQQALLDDLADGALPGIREGVERVERDERWHVGFGLRCLAESGKPELVDEVLVRAGEAATAWGDAVPVATQESVMALCRHRLSVAGLLQARTAAGSGAAGSVPGAQTIALG